MLQNLNRVARRAVIDCVRSMCDLNINCVFANPQATLQPARANEPTPTHARTSLLRSIAWTRHQPRGHGPRPPCARPRMSDRLPRAPPLYPLRARRTHLHVATTPVSMRQNSRTLRAPPRCALRPGRPGRVRFTAVCSLNTRNTQCCDVKLRAP